MLRLDLAHTPSWLDLDHGVRLHLAPLNGRDHDWPKSLAAGQVPPRRVTKRQSLPD